MNKSTLIAIGIFLALAVGAAFTLTRAPERGISRLSFTEVDPAQVDKLEITGKNPVTLVREGEAWRVEGGKLADGAMVKRLVESIPKMASSDLSTEDKARFAELEVDDEKGARVKAYAAGQPVAEFVVGKSARGGSYVRVGEQVFTVAQVFAPTYSREASQWLEKKLFEDKIDQVTRVEVKVAGATPFALVKKDNAWQLEDQSVLPKGFRFDANAARGLVAALTTLRAKDVLVEQPAADATGLAAGDSFAYLVEEGEGEAKTTTRRELKLGKALADKSAYAQVTGKDDVVTLPEFTVKNLRKAPTDFRDLRLMDLDQGKVVKLVITGETEKLTLVKDGALWKLQSASVKPPADFVPDVGMVMRRISALANARAAKVADKPGAAGLGAVSVAATLEDKRTVTLSFGKTIKEDNQEWIYARGNADSAVYLVNKWTRDNLTGGYQTLQKPPSEADGLANLDPKTLAGLPPEVREGLLKQIEQKKQQQMLIERLHQQQPVQAQGAKAAQ